MEILGAIAEIQPRERSEGHSSRAKTESDVLKIIDTIKTNWCNPFDLDSVPESLINICTGKEVSEEVEKSLVGFMDNVLNRKKSNQKERNNPDNFWKPCKRSRIKSSQSQRNILQ